MSDALRPRPEGPPLPAPLRWALALALLAGVVAAAWWLHGGGAAARWFSHVVVPVLGLTYLGLIVAALVMGARDRAARR